MVLMLSKTCILLAFQFLNVNVPDREMFEEAVNRRMTENIMAKMKRTKGQTMLCKILHRIQLQI